jgi:nucleotide-binding universal stress UspA family protein
MVNILVPTDFSPLSKVAVEYAIEIANTLNGNVTLLHVITIPNTIRVTMHEKMKEIQDEMMQSVETDMRNLIREVSYSVLTGNQVQQSIVRNADFNEAVLEEAERLRSGLIVMGTRGASGIKKALVGSNTTAVISQAKIPVLAVPATCKFRGMKDIVYASDLKHLDVELKILMPYVQRFGTTIHLLHVAPAGTDVATLEDKIEDTIKSLGYSNIVTVVTVDENVHDAILQYVSVSKASLLAMFTHNPTFYEKLFDKSVTRAMAFDSSVPLLAFKQGMKIPIISRD